MQEHAFAWDALQKMPTTTTITITNTNTTTTSITATIKSKGLEIIGRQGIADCEKPPKNCTEVKRIHENFRRERKGVDTWKRTSYNNNDIICKRLQKV